MSALEFLPNSPTLMNAGTGTGQLSACFVVPVPDDLGGIFDSLGLMARIQQSGGGTGFSFSSLRPRGDLVRSTGGPSSGALSFMRIFDCTTDNIRQGGRRRGANMGVLRVDHPDIEEFIDSKRDDKSFRNFNISVGVTDAFMEAARGLKSFALLHPKTGEPVHEVDAPSIMARIADAAWRSGDPGLLFLDAIERANPTPALGRIEATNPCGEVPLLPYEACNLGSINLTKVVRDAAIDWDRLGRLARLAVRFLDDAIDVSNWPDERIASVVRGNRKIGLGVMGFAEFLILLGIPYDSPIASETADRLMAFIAREARAASQELAIERGVFPNWRHSIHAANGVRMRNATLTSIAPTGSIGIIAGTSAGIEPLFALAYRRCHVLEEQTLIEISPLLRRYAKENGFDSPELLEHLRTQGTLEGYPDVPRRIACLFRTAHAIAPSDHLRIQAAFQRHVDNAVSKTINLPNSATVAEIVDIYRQAWELGLKGITVYRDGCRGEQILEIGFDSE